MTETEPDQKSIVIATGMSGSGDHTAFKACEDLGYFSVDNLPVELVDRLVQLTIASGERIEKLAVVVDIRFLPNPNFVPELRIKRGNDPEVIDYMDSFSETGETIDL